jgi:hypothetical protein
LRALRREIMAANGWSLRDLYRTLAAQEARGERILPPGLPADYPELETLSIEDCSQPGGWGHGQPDPPRPVWRRSSNLSAPAAALESPREPTPVQRPPRVPPFAMTSQERACHEFAAFAAALKGDEKSEAQRFVFPRFEIHPCSGLDGPE